MTTPNVSAKRYLLVLMHDWWLFLEQIGSTLSCFAMTDYLQEADEAACLLLISMDVCSCSLNAKKKNLFSLLLLWKVISTCVYWPVAQCFHMFTRSCIVSCSQTVRDDGISCSVREHWLDATFHTALLDKFILEAAKLLAKMLFFKKSFLTLWISYPRSILLTQTAVGRHWCDVGCKSAK